MDVSLFLEAGSPSELYIRVIFTLVETNENLVPVNTAEGRTRKPIS